MQDFTAYKIASVKPLELEEQSLQSKICLYAGSTYVDDTFATLLEPYLAARYPETVIKPDHLEKAGSMFSNLRKHEFSLDSREKAGGFWIVDSEESSFDGGGIEIPW